MSKQWAEDESKMGFSGPPAEIGWADHEEVVAQLTERVAFFRDMANDWHAESGRLQAKYASLVAIAQSILQYPGDGVPRVALENVLRDLGEAE